MKTKRGCGLHVWLVIMFALSLWVLLHYDKLVDGIIYKPLDFDFTIQKGSAVLNLERKLNLLEDALSCCASKFSIIFLQLDEPRDLEKFLKSKLSSNAITNRSRVDIILSLGLAYQNESLLTGFKNILSESGSMERLKAKMVKAVSIDSNNTLCQLCRDGSDELQRNSSTEKHTFDFRIFLRDIKLGFGIEFYAYKNSGKCCRDRDLPMLQDASFILLRIPMPSSVFTMETFSSILQTEYSDALRHLATTYPKATTIFTALEKVKEEDEGFVKSGRYKNSEDNYNNLLAAFSYKFAESLKRDVTGLKAMGNFYDGTESVAKWIEVVQLHGSAYFETVSCDKASDDKYLTEMQRIDLVDIIIKKFKRIQTRKDVDDWEFWDVKAFPWLVSKISEENANRKNGSELHTTLQVLISLKNQDDLAQDIERLRKLIKEYPRVIDTVIFNIEDHWTYPASSYTSMFRDLRKQLEPLGIQVGVTDTSLYGRDYKVNQELQRVVDFVQLSFTNILSGLDYTDTKSVEGGLAKISASAKDRYPDTKISIELYTYSDEIDYLMFRSYTETVWNWAQAYSLSIVLECSWHERVTQIPSTAPYSSFRFNIPKEACVKIDPSNITNPINFTKSQSGLTLRLDAGRFQNVSDQTKAMLFKMITLKFRLVEIVSQRSTKLVGFLENIAEGISSKSGINLYINLNVSMLENVENTLIPSTIKLQNNIGFNIVRGLHIDMRSCLEGPQDVFESATQYLQKLRRNVVPASIKMGYVASFTKSTQELSQREIGFLHAIDYVVLHIDLLQLRADLEISYFTQRTRVTIPRYAYEDYNVSTAQVFKDEKFYSTFEQFKSYRDNIRKHRPIINVILRMRWPSGQGAGWFMQNYLLFWSFVNDFSLVNNYPYFIYEAFDTDDSGSSNGWFEVTNYSDLGHINNYKDKELTYLGLETLRPTLENATKVQHPFPSLASLLVPICTLISALIFVIIYLGIRVRQQKMVLSKQEVQRLLYGYKPEYGEEFRFDMTITGQFWNRVSTIQRFGGPVAVKIPKLEDASKSASTIKSMLAEIKIMSYIGEHQNVLKLLGAYTKKIRKGIVYVVTEYCELGSLISYLRSLPNTSAGSDEQTQVVNLLELNQFCMEIGRGMEYLGSKRVIHGDLAARNVLLTGTKTCKVSDFGLSRHLKKYDLYKKQGEEPLPWRWMAIESLQRQEFTVKSDMWSYGVTIWEIFSLGEQPFPEETWNGDYCTKLEEGLRLRHPKLASSNIYNKMKTCWDLEPQRRPDFSEVAVFFQQLQPAQYETLVE